MFSRRLSGAGAALVLAGGFLLTGAGVAAAGSWISVEYQDSASYPFPRGFARFYPDAVDEQVEVCDRMNDGLTVSAQLRYHGAVQLEVTDRTGPDIFCAKQNLDIPEGTPVSLRVCVQNLDCTAWHDGVS
ncbi:VIT1/CCC1 transporter family protein [Amycolatopsis keratiniphila]|uniref:Uncharacterized protein n=1 Tax=Amycolatopsis keratiniphila subsp. keratiniphila TaxID=227715 RepID=A0A1W2M1L6_9PSEU|nr:hypothetical protein [Amycolatopsis keratiniphila]ONF73748.1 hypothetical protein AVR91_0206515 [Amycolatopsis keratiniphila subsp. keratiniphila]